MPLITRAQLGRVAPRALPHVANAVRDHAAHVLPRYGIVTPLRIQHFMAQVLVESAFLRRLEEDLSYTADRIHAVWPHHFPTVAAARPYEHRPEALAAVVYGGRMGNHTPEEAYADRGLGLLQTTGHDNLAWLAGRLHVSIDQIRPMLVSDAWMLECAAASFVGVGALPHADRDDVAAVTRAVNGGETGLADRRAALKLCRRVWTAAAVIAPAALIPKPMPFWSPPVPSIDTARLASAVERIAADPKTAEMAQRLLTGAGKAVISAPANGWLAGKKTYIVAGLGVASTTVTVALAMEQHGGLTPTGWCAAIVALVTSGGFATLRAAMSRHFGDLAGLLMQMAQGAALEAIGNQADAVATAPAAAAEDVLGAVATGIASVLPHG